MKILMVCLGNICRSPMAEGILRHKAEKEDLDIEVDSAGMGPWHVGENPDYRANFTARKYGVDISTLIARQFHESDFDRFDKIYVMDRNNFADVVSQARTDEDIKKVDLILNLTKPGSNKPVTDPYYGGDEGFDKVFALLDKACDVLVNSLK